jgi:hypothetical protein
MAIKIPKSGSPHDVIKDRESALAWGLQPLKKGQQPPQANNPGSKKFRSIKAFLNELHDEEATPELISVFRQYWPHMKNMTMREAWLRVVYLEAIAGQPWASLFVADRTEGKVGEGGISSDKGTILKSIENMMENPITTREEA